MQQRGFFESHFLQTCSLIMETAGAGIFWLALWELSHDRLRDAAPESTVTSCRASSSSTVTGLHSYHFSMVRPPLSDVGSGIKMMYGKVVIVDRRRNPVHSPALPKKKDMLGEY